MNKCIIIEKAREQITARAGTVLVVAQSTWWKVSPKGSPIHAMQTEKWVG
jgi:hypothetical protein